MSRGVEEKLEGIAETQRLILRMLLLLCGLQVPTSNQEAINELSSILEGLRSNGKT